MQGPAGADDPALEQARQAQLAPHAYLDGWRGRYAPAPAASAPHSPASVNTVAVAPSAAQGGADGARPEPVPAGGAADGTAAADATVQIAEAKLGARPQPVPPALDRGQREAGRLRALRMNAERRDIRARLQAGELTLAQVLAQDDAAARGMRVRTLLLALPGVGTAKARRLLAAAGVSGTRRGGALTSGQRGRLLAATAGPAPGAAHDGAPPVVD